MGSRLTLERERERERQRNDPSVHTTGVEKGRLLFRAWRILKASCILPRHELPPTKVPRNDEVFPDVAGVAG